MKAGKTTRKYTARGMRNFRARIVWKATAPEHEQIVHTSKNVSERLTENLAERVWWTKSQSSLRENIYFRLSWFQSSLLLIYFRHCPDTCTHKRVAQNHPICDPPLSRLVRRSIAPLQKSRRNHPDFHGWYGMDFVQAQELSGIASVNKT